jgi:hypothetical protein
MATPAAKFPAAIADDSWLTIATNQLQTRLAVPCGANDTTIGVVDASRIAQWSLLTLIDSTNGAPPAGVSEIVLVTQPPAGNILTVQRGYDGTTAAAHGAGITISGYIVGWHQKSLAGEVKAIEQALGPNLSNVGSGLPGVYVASKYGFVPQSPGGSLVVGNNSITLSPVPLGVNGTDANHWLYVDQGTGTPEPVLITGGSAVSGAPTGTLIISCKNTHSGAWRISTATGGAQEAAVIAAAAGGGLVWLNSSTIHAPIHPPYQKTIWFQGNGRSATVVSVGADFPLTEAGVFVFSPTQVSAINADSGGVRDLTISLIQPDSTDLASYTHWPPAVYASGNNHVTVDSVIIERAWDAITSPVSNGITVNNVGMSYFHRGVTVDQCFDAMNINQLEGWPFGCTLNQTNTFSAPATNNYLLDLSQVDFGCIDGVLSASGKFAKLQKNAGGQVPMIWGTNIDIDTNGGFEMSNGYVRLSNVSVSLTPGTEAFIVTGGTLSIDGVSIGNSGATTPHFLYNASQNNSGAATGIIPGLTITNLRLASNNELGYVVYATTSGPYTGISRVSVAGADIAKTPGVAYGALFAEAGGTGSVIMDLSHIRVASNGGTAAVFANFSTALNHSISF